MLHSGTLGAPSRHSGRNPSPRQPLPRYARVITPGRPPTYELLFLDKHGRPQPHHTGTQITPTQSEDVLSTELWDDTPTIPKPEYGSPHLQEVWERVHAKHHAIIGPITIAYPRNTDWHPFFLDPDRNGILLKLSAPNNTQHHPLPNRSTHGVPLPQLRAHLEAACPTHNAVQRHLQVLWHGALRRYQGKTRRRLIHRALNMRNRHPGTDHS